jgi:Domain of unknown function (DUF1992)
MSFTSWIDQQIAEATERGAFDNLPGAGKPIPNRGDADDGMAWLRDYVRREGVSAEELLPAPLRLRKEAQRLAESVQDLSSEQEVATVVADLNRRIMEWRRIPLGPPVFVPLVDEELMVSRWRDGRPVTPPAASGPVARSSAGAAHPPGRRWWHRPGRGRGQ